MIFIDSANINEIKSAIELGWVDGVTTNPILLAKENHDPTSLYKDIRVITAGPVFYQLVSNEVGEMQEEAGRISQILWDQLVLKIIPTDIGFKFCRQNNHKYDICITAVFDTIQSVVAANSGARFIAVYYNRAQRNAGNAADLISAISSILLGTSTEILAASLKSPEEVRIVLKSGAQHIAAPLTVLRKMTKNELSKQAIDSFFQNGVGIDAF
jgi:transaldolase